MRKLFWTLNIIIVLLFHIDAIGQNNYFNKFILTSGSENPAGVLFCDSFYLIYGHKIETSTLDQVIYLYKIDLLGNLIQEKRYGTPEIIYARSDSKGIIQTSDSTFAFVATIIDTATIIGNRELRYGKLFVVNQSLDTIFTRNYYDTTSLAPDSYLTFEDIIQTADKHLYISGTYRTTNHPNCKAVVLKVDSNGTEVWRKLYGTGYRTIPYSLEAFNNERLIVSGATKILSQESDGWIICLDLDGKIIWERVLGGNFKDWIYTTSVSHQDSTIYASICDTWKISIVEYMQANVYSLTIDSGIIMENDTIDDFFWNLPEAMHIDNDQNITFAIDVYVIDSVNWWGGMVSGVYKVSETFDSLWFRLLDKVPLYNINGEYYMTDMIRTPDNGYFIVGEYRAHEPTIGHFQTWILKLDSLGCDSPGCHLASVPQNLLIVEPLNIYPNPADTEITIGIPSTLGIEETMISVFNLSGQKIIEIAAKSEQKNYKIDVCSLDAGMYTVVMRSKKGISAGGSFIKK